MGKQPKQLIIYSGLVDIVLKFLFGIFALLIFGAVAYFLLAGECGWKEKLVYGSVEGILAFSASRIFKHYWPVSGD